MFLSGLSCFCILWYSIYMIENDFFDNIKGLIYSQGLNVSKVARMMGMKEITLINKLKRDTLKASELKKLCDTIGYKIEYIKVKDKKDLLKVK